ncbi:hypothetical protein I4U23_021510 [Adineta vaga]|nr:hypothetical protein I4U23_021510 [Adineta vaga]
MTNQTLNIHFRFQGLLSIVQWFLNLLITINQIMTSFMFHLVIWYDLYVYTPLQMYLSPHMAHIPRVIQIGNKTITVFNANIVTYSRTLLIIPIAWCLKFNHPISACLLVLFHDFLDHIDGIVAKVHKRIYGDNIDDPLLGGFMDAFCDKIVNVFCLWTIIQETHFEQTSTLFTMLFVLLCYTIIALETAIGIVRVQDYFHAALLGNKYNINSTSAVMEGKLKEKLESIGLAFLCLSTDYLSPFEHWSGISGVLCFALTIRLAYISLMKKLQARQINDEKKKSVTINEQICEIEIPVQKSIAVMNSLNLTNVTKTRQRAMTVNSSREENEKMKRISFSSSNDSEDETNERQSSNSSSSSEIHNESSPVYQRSASLPSIWIDGRADKVYTVGCFDLFHEGHRLLLQRMRQYGRQVIVGVHDSRSIHKLKKRVPVDGTETRMLNVKRYADEVYCVAGTDPSNFVKCIVHLRENETAVYIRGDDMADFPCRDIVEELMPVKFLPYTSGVSSTQLRKELFSHIQADDIEHLEKVN